MQMVAEQAAGARAPTQITSYSNHALEQFAGRDGGIGVSQSALSGAWSSPLKIEYVPSKYGPTFRCTGTDAVIVVNAEGFYPQKERVILPTESTSTLKRSGVKLRFLKPISESTLSELAPEFCFICVRFFSLAA